MASSKEMKMKATVGASKSSVATEEEEYFGSAADANKFIGSPDVQVEWLLGPIAESGNVSDFLSLLEKYPCVFEDMAVRTSNTPLHIAARKGHLELVKAIWEARPRLAEQLNRDGLSPLHIACENDHDLVVMELLHRNPGLYGLKDCHGRTILHCAAIRGKDGLIYALIEFINSRSSNLEDDGLEDVTDRGETALHLALKHNHNKCYEILMRRLDQPQVKEETATAEGESRKRKVLYNLMDKEGKTVIQLSQRKPTVWFPWPWYKNPEFSSLCALLAIILGITSNFGSDSSTLNQILLVCFSIISFAAMAYRIAHYFGNIGRKTLVLSLLERAQPSDIEISPLLESNIERSVLDRAERVLDKAEVDRVVSFLIEKFRRRPRRILRKADAAA